MLPAPSFLTIVCNSLDSPKKVTMSLKSSRGFYPFFGRKSILCVLIPFLFLLGGTEGARLNSLTDKEIEKLKTLDKPAVKTILSEDGDIIDCVDIYKQPALHHPLLRNHTIETRPSFVPTTVESNNSVRFFVQQIWQKNGGCPVGTIPIQRIRERDLVWINDSSKNFSLNGEFSNCKVEVARVELHRDGPYTGAQGTINVWNLHVEMNEWSLNSVSVFDVHDSFLEAGWAVSPILFGDVKPRLFVNWMDALGGQGCFNLRCAGFVQVSNKIVLGGTLPNVSNYDGRQFSFTFTTYKDAAQRKWWMLFEGEPVGYWPASLIDSFEWVPRVNWGGSVCNTEAQGYHTTTQMGNGHFPEEEYKRASHIRNILVMRSDQDWVPPSYIKGSASYKDCYRVTHDFDLPDDKGPSMFYGGPGGKCCDGRCEK